MKEVLCKSYSAMLSDVWIEFVFTYQSDNSVTYSFYCGDYLRGVLIFHATPCAARCHDVLRVRMLSVMPDDVVEYCNSSIGVNWEDFVENPDIHISNVMDIFFDWLEKDVLGGDKEKNTGITRKFYKPMSNIKE